MTNPFCCGKLLCIGNELFLYSINIEGVKNMRIRKQALGDRNIVGARIEAKRKELGIKQIDLLTQLQIKGVELTASGLSKLEGQIRSVCDYELVAIAEVLGVSINWLVGKED